MTHRADLRWALMIATLSVGSALAGCGAAPNGPDVPSPAASSSTEPRSPERTRAPNVDPPAPPHDLGAGSTPREARVSDQGIDQGSPKPTGVVHVVSMKGGVFSPRSLSIPIGDSVEFVWEPGTIASVTSGLACRPDMVFDSGEHEAPWKYRVTFLRPGIFGFFNAPSCEEMNGALYVTQ